MRVGVAVEDDVAVLVLGRPELRVGDDIDGAVRPIPPGLSVEASLGPRPCRLGGASLRADDEDHAVAKGVAEWPVAMRALIREARLLRALPLIALTLEVKPGFAFGPGDVVEF